MKRDLRILQRVGINILSIAPHVVILDTRNMARDIPGPISTRLGGRTPISSFTLSAILAALGYSHDEADLHNARNDATCALFALLGLAVRSSQAKRLKNAESARLEHLVRITAPARSRGGWPFHLRAMWVGTSSSTCPSKPAKRSRISTQTSGALARMAATGPKLKLWTTISMVIET